MAKRPGFPQYLVIGGYNVSGDVGAINSCSLTRELQRVTGLDKSAAERLALQVDSALEFATFFNDATDALHDALSALPTADVVATWLLGASVGDPFFGLVAKVADYAWERAESGALTGTTQLEGSAGAPGEFGVLLTDGIETIASASTGDSVDEGAQSTYGGVGYLEQVAAASGTATILIQDSADDSSFATLLTFDTTGDGTKGGERKTVTGTVDRYVRRQLTGTFSNWQGVIGWRRGLDVDDEDLS